MTEPLITPQAETPCTDDYCVTCSDEGRPGVVIADGIVRTAMGEEPVDLTLVPGAAPGDHVLIHAGFAIARLEDESEAL